MSSIKPLVSVIIVNWNGRQWLPGCLKTLEKQTLKSYELILVDNGSSDDSVAYVRKHHQDVVLVENPSNSGFAGGNNIGYKHAKGDYIVLVNNDTESPPDYLENFVRAFDEIPNLGSAQSKIILLNDRDRLDVCGAYWSSSTYLYHYGFAGQQNAPKYNKIMPFFSNKGASMIIKREVIEKVGLFDDDFWCYYEETDFCHRVWLAGYECWYYPKAVVYHAMGGTALTFESSLIQFHNFKNKLLSFLKNFSLVSLLSVIPIYLLVNFVVMLFFLARGKYHHVGSLFRAYWWNLTHLPATIQKRYNVQRLRRVGDIEIARRVKKKPRLSYYVKMLRSI